MNGAYQIKVALNCAPLLFSFTLMFILAYIKICEHYLYKCHKDVILKLTGSRLDRIGLALSPSSFWLYFYTQK